MIIDNKFFPCIVRSQFKELGTDIDIQIVAGDEAQIVIANEDIQKIKKMYVDFTDIFSRFNPKSELSKLNKNLGTLQEASFHMREIVLQALKYNKETRGFFDPRILDVLERVGYADDFERGIRQLAKRSSVDGKEFVLNRDLAEDLKLKNDEVFFGARMDFSGIAKGYITDQIVKFLIEKKWQNFLIDSGGDIFMSGLDEEGEKWTVDVEGIDKNKLIFALSNRAITTSGIGKRRWEIEGKRMHHIINPKNPEQFSFDLKSVSVIADSTTKADVLAKTIFLMGKENGILYVREHELAVVMLDSRGSAWISSKAKELLI
ncbi:MAG: FAD:protein FMN transferase [Candidatus Moranbacteria bacterium]|nr:FAD:protein FMN transferase [Candidatus Moranbacteria bacterium]